MVTFDYKKTPITQIADYIIMYSAKSGASDIHFDPRENGLMVRIRVDGELQDYTLIPNEYERNLATRLKLLANMNITESRLPQDGAIKGTFGKLYLDMRVSSLPTNLGEKIVIRILDYSRSLEGLDSLGFNDKNFEKLNRMIAVPNGIILVTGATGSGKSTTTYSILQELNKTETNIITVEDPIEMNIEGLNQVQVNSEIGLDFATVLRSILRQDPNVILIGEIRDSETAKIAVRASITGHLVLSTIHTNNSLSTIERLLDMDVERYLLSSALTGIISQRLAKKLCEKCRKEQEATPYEKKIFKNVLGKDIEKLFVANENGCDECHKGYKGRIAIQEVLEIDDEIRDALNNEKLTKEERRELVYTSNVITMLQDGLLKVLDGLTSFDEIYRIIEIDSDSSENYGIEFSKNNNKKEPNKETENTNAEIKTPNKVTTNIETESNPNDTASEITTGAPKSVLNDTSIEDNNKNVIIEIPHIPVNLDNQISNEKATTNDNFNDFYSSVKIDNNNNNDDDDKTIESNDTTTDTESNDTTTDTETNNIEVPTIEIAKNNENDSDEIKYGELSNDAESNEYDSTNITIPITETTEENNDSNTIVYSELSNISNTTDSNNSDNDEYTNPQIINSTVV